MTPHADRGAARGREPLTDALRGAWAEARSDVRRSLDKLVADAKSDVRRSLDKLVADAKTDVRHIKSQGGAFGQSMTARALPILRAARATPRAARLAREAGLILAEYRWHEVRARFLGAEAARAARDALHLRAAARLHRLCVELRGAILKLGQFASTRRDLLPPAYAEALALLQDSVPPVPFERIAERIRAELGAPIEDLFAAFDPHPIAAASLAQVHGAVLADGTRVAVKVQVPGVETEVEGDLSLFTLLAGGVRDLFPSLDLAPFAAELGRSVREELDYRLEASRARRMADDMAVDPSIRVPRVHEHLSSARVLTMDRIDGERLTDFLDRARGDTGAGGQADLAAILSALIRTYAHQILATGRFQADPHPGNFLVCPGPRLALLDFGAIAELTGDERRAYVALTGAVITRDRKRAADLMTGLGFQLRGGAQGGGDPDALIAFADLLLDAFRPAPDRPLADLDPRAAFDEALALGRESPILIPNHFVQVGRVLASLAGLLFAYRPPIQLWPLIAPFLVEAAPAPPG